jgi:hypothetical protein
MIEMPLLVGIPCLERPGTKNPYLTSLGLSGFWPVRLDAQPSRILLMDP